MFPYLFVFAICLFLNSRSSSKNIVPVLLSCLFLSLLAGFRDMNIGIDTSLYPPTYMSAIRNIKGFSDFVTMDTYLDKGFLFIYWVSSWFTDQIWMGLFLTELVICVFTFLGCYRLNKYLEGNITVFTIVFLFLTYNLTLNVMRQQCALAVSFFAFTYLWEKRWIPYFFWTLIAFSFHITTVISLIIPIVLYVANIKNDQKRKIGVFLLLMIALIAFLSFYYVLSLVIDMGLFTEVYEDRYGEDGKYGGLNKISSAPLLVCFMIFYIMFISKKHQIIDKNVFSFHFMVNAIYLGCLFLSLLSVFLHRIGLCFFNIDIFLMSVELSSKKLNPIIRFSVLLVVILFWLLKNVVHNDYMTYPYTSKILGID